jgi:hypothetical protein
MTEPEPANYRHVCIELPEATALLERFDDYEQEVIQVLVHDCFLASTITALAERAALDPYPLTDQLASGTSTLVMLLASAKGWTLQHLLDLTTTADHIGQLLTAHMRDEGIAKTEASE